MKDENHNLLSIALIPWIIVFVVAAVLPFAALQAFVAWKLYNWFLLPLGLPLIAFTHFWGILLFKNTITSKRRSKSKNPSEPFIDLAIETVVLGTILLIGWVIK